MKHKIHKVIFLCVSSLCISLICSADEMKHSYVPKEGFVPNEICAAKIAEAILIPIYGEERISAQRPFSATLKDDIWTVVGTLPSGKKGGVAEVELSKTNGQILRVSHSR